MSTLQAQQPLALTASEAAEMPPAKRRKLSPQEKEAQEREKAVAKARRDEEKRLKEEERKAREEERKKKAEEKEEKKRERELEKEEKRREKQLEIDRKEAERRRKEQNQPKLSNFFASRQPANVNKRASTPTQIHANSHNSDSPCTTTASTSPEKKPLSDYEQSFLPFQTLSHTILAPVNRFPSDDLEDEVFKSTLPALELLRSVGTPLDPQNWQWPSIVDIVAVMQGLSEDDPIDLTSSPSKALEDITVKYLHFSEDVRPPYCGTYTKQVPKESIRRMICNPSSPDNYTLNYDYDSEAEWEDTADGEDLNSDDEEDVESEDADDMEDFLDDEDDCLKRSCITSDLVVNSTGLCWEDANGHNREDLKQYKMGFLLESAPQSIDPFSTAYWHVPAVKPIRAAAASELSNAGGLHPPRIPLGARPTNMTLVGPGLVVNEQGPSKALKRQVPMEYMQQFKDAIQGSDLTKIALVEALKKQFPKIPKDAIQHTLSLIAVRTGSHNNDKQWVLCE